MNILLKIQVKTKSQNLMRIAATTKWWSKPQTARAHLTSVGLVKSTGVNLKTMKGKVQIHQVI